MTELLTSIGTVMTAFWGWFADAATALIANEIFIIVLAVAVIGIVIAALTYLVSQISIRLRSKRKGN